MYHHHGFVFRMWGLYLLPRLDDLEEFDIVAPEIRKIYF